MNRSIGDDNTDSGIRSIGDLPTMQGIYREIRIGAKIGPDNRYLIKDILGKGGMGEVYLAFDEISKTEVAIKLVPREVSTSEDEMEQVRKNFALVRNLHHPNIAAVTALERLASGEYILVMEAVQGRRTLQKERLSRENERVPVAEAIQICKQVAEALDYAHKQRVIHRDVKPSNVLLTPDGQVKLTDFGLAAQILSSMNRVSMLPTRTSGTRPYMAPEQWEGRLQDIQTDQWALAVLFYELVTGRLPFPAGDLGVLEKQILEKTPEKPEALTDNQWSSLRRALSKEREDRFPSCAEFVQTLSDNKRQRLQRKTKKRSPLGVLLLLLCIVGLGIYAYRYFVPDLPLLPAQQVSTPAISEEDIARREALARQEIEAERQAREQAEARAREQEQAADRAREEAARIQRERDQAEQARIAAERLEQAQRAEAHRLAQEAEARRAREAEEAAQREMILTDAAECLKLRRLVPVYSAYLARVHRERMETWREHASKGMPEAQWIVGHCYDAGVGVARDPSEAFVWFSKAAQQGYAPAEVELARCYLSGVGVSKNISESLRYTRMAAEKNDAWAQLMLANYYERGELGVERNVSEAATLYRKAADQGLAVAQHSLAMCYHHGRGVEEDNTKALNWMLKAADGGLVQSQFMAGQMYERGIGTSKNYSEALKWYERAIQGEHPSAKERAEQMKIYLDLEAHGIRVDL